MDSATKHHILQCREEGISIRQIACGINRSHTTVSKFLKDYDELGLGRRHGSGRKRVTTEEDDSLISFLLNQNARVSANDVRAALNLKTDRQISDNTIYRRMREVMEDPLKAANILVQTSHFVYGQEEL